MSYKTIESGRTCTLGPHNPQHSAGPKHLRLVVDLRTHIENPMPHEMVPFGPGGAGYNKTVITYVYRHHFCSSCNLVYYFPELTKTEKEAVDKLKL